MNLKLRSWWGVTGTGGAARACVRAYELGDRLEIGSLVEVDQIGQSHVERVRVHEEEVDGWACVQWATCESQ